MIFSHLSEATKKMPKAEQELRELLPLKVIEARYDEIIKALVNTMTPEHLDAVEAGLHSTVPQDDKAFATAREQVEKHLSQYGQLITSDFNNTIASVMIPSGLQPNPIFHREMQASRWVNHILRVSKDGKQLVATLQMVTPFHSDKTKSGSHVNKSKKSFTIEAVLADIDSLYNEVLIPQTRKVGTLPGAKRAA